MALRWIMRRGVTIGTNLALSEVELLGLLTSVTITDTVRYDLVDGRNRNEATCGEPHRTPWG
jgi:hypothetical protein